jgi:hypothetical protein
MYNQVSKIINISQYKVSNTILAYKDKNSNVFRNFEKVSECGYDDISIIGQSIFFNDKEGNVLKIDQNQEVFKENSTLLNFSSDIITSNQLIYLDSLENLNLCDLNSKLDYNLKGINYNWENIFLSNNESTIFLIGNTSIHSYTLPTSQPLWQFDLGSLGEYVNISNEKCSYEIRFFLGIYNGCLLVQLSNATFIWIDCNTGKQKHILNLNESYPLPKPVFYDDSFKAYIVGEKLIFLNNQRLLHINLDSFEVTIIQDYFTQERADQYRFMHTTYFEDKIYFVADYGWQYVTPSYVGAMDAYTGEVLWKQQLENTGGLSEAPQVNSDKLYIRTNSNVLHIFEKE